ncbi:condensin complex component cnd1 [Terfezia claveryi]|nr:condensin complex component cnd1 [Terfezia claveryi]
MMDDGEKIQFDLNESLKYYLNEPTSVPCDNADPELVECEGDGEALTKEQINRILDPIIDAIAENPEAISKGYAFDSIQCMLKLFPALPSYAVAKVFDLIISGLSSEADVANQDVEADEQETLPMHKELLEMYGFLLQWAVQATENLASEKSASAPVAKGRKGTKVKTAGGKQAFDSSTQLITALDAMVKVFKLKLQRIFVTTSERDSFVQLFTRPSYVVIENEQRVKSNPIRMHVWKVLCMAVKHHGHGFGAQTSIVQSLSYFEHLSEPMAEFLQILSEQYDYPQLVDEILKELSNKEYNSNDLKGPKSVSIFIAKLSQLCPRLVIKQMILLIRLLDNESYTLRCAIIEVCGNLIVDLTKQDERTEDHKKQIDGFFDVLEERFIDINPYCRSRSIQVFTKLLDLDTKFPQRRQRCAELAARSLEDKSSHVRRNAIKLLASLVQTHPFRAHDGFLALKDWQKRLEQVEAELDALKPADAPEMAPGNETVDIALLDAATQMDIDPPRDEDEPEEEAPIPPQQNNEEGIKILQLTRRYHLDAINFTEIIHTASEAVSLLLSSKNKAEVIEAMDFFKIIDAYRVETARDGIRKMLRLIWTKGNSDEGKGVQTHLIECYKNLFFEAPESFSENDAANYVSRNMISLTFGTSPAELTSLEQLLSTMMKAGHVPDLVLQKLWQVYGIQKRDISKKQRRGAIIVLGMLAIAEPEIVVKELETIVRIGLGQFGRGDLALAKYSCVAIRHIVATGRQAKDNPNIMAKLPNDHAILIRLGELLEIVTDQKEWYGVAEEAIGAIYALAKHPDFLCSNIIRRRAKQVFSGPAPSGSTVDEAGDTPMEDAPMGAEPPSPKPIPTPAKTTSHASDLSQLLFIVGHVAIKQIVHLELLEIEFKKRKAMQDRNRQASPTKGGAAVAQAAQDELDLIGGTTEDDFTDAMQMIRERELLYGPKSLLARFGPLVTEVCHNVDIYRDKTLQTTANLCLGKLMCVSSEYCDKNLNLFLTRLANSADPNTRSNAVIALGDMAVCFNHLIDENTDFLYQRLNDPDPSVKRTCLMTLTFLILAGQVKVKGQLGEMAKCLEDKDRKIADLARMFFTELATKDNAIYNQFIDIFSVLTASSSGPSAGVNGAPLEEDAMKRVIKFLCGFIEKDKHARQLAEKLAARLARCETERQWNDVAYALSLLQHKSEEIQRQVQGGFKMVQSLDVGNRGFIPSTATAGEDGTNIIEGARAASPAPTVLDKRTPAKGGRKGSAAKASGKPATTRGGRAARGKKKQVDDSDEISDAPPPPAKAAAKPTRGGGRKKAPVVEDSDEQILDAPPPPKTGVVKGRKKATEDENKDDDKDDSDRQMPLPQPAKKRPARGGRRNRPVVEESDDDSE